MLFLPFTHPYLDPVPLCEEAQITVVSPAETFFSKMENNNAVIAQNTGLFKMIVRVIHNTLQMQPHVISFLGFCQGSGLCSSSSRKYPGTEGTNQNRY